MPMYMPSQMARFEQRIASEANLVSVDITDVNSSASKPIPAALKLLNHDGVILLHDYFPQLSPLWSDGLVIPGPFLAAHRLMKEGANLVVLPLGKLPWPSKLQSNQTSLALLLRRE